MNASNSGSKPNDVGMEDEDRKNNSQASAAPKSKDSPPQI